ncbi:TonB-dependent receptor, partial [Acinetobacter baumannii]
MLRISISSPQIKGSFPLSLLSLMILNIQGANAEELIGSSSKAAASMPTIKIEAMSELDPIKSYIDYDKANVTRNGLDKKDIPQTVDTIDVQKYKIYGSNDLSVMLQGTPGVSTSYDMRGDGITIRGFGADTGDIYRDGIRESGQVRRSTANIERIEILKGPASVLYGRSAGGGVVNMVSKFANFDSKSSVGAYAGSYDNYGTTADINQVLNDNLAVRLTGEYGEAGSFRSGIENKIEMFSPSFTYKNDDGKLTWTTQYTYDKLGRVPDRGPTRDNLPAGTSIKMGFAQDGDYVDDILQVVRSDVNYEYAPDWNFHWAASYRQAEQNFDHFYFGNYCGLDGKNSKNEACTKKAYIDQIYYWQQTSNKTTTNTFDIKGKFKTGQLEHQIMVGTDWTYEQREPRLANKTQNGSAIYGYVNPITGEREYSRGNGPLKISQHNYNEGTTYGVFMQDLIGLNDQLK